MSHVRIEIVNKRSWNSTTNPSDHHKWALIFGKGGYKDRPETLLALLNMKGFSLHNFYPACISRTAMRKFKEHKGPYPSMTMRLYNANKT